MATASAAQVFELLLIRIVNHVDEVPPTRIADQRGHAPVAPSSAASDVWPLPPNTNFTPYRSLTPELLMRSMYCVYLAAPPGANLIRLSPPKSFAHRKSGAATLP